MTIRKPGDGGKTEFVHPPCATPGCLNPVVQRPGEDNKDYRRRISCERACYHRYIEAQHAAYQHPLCANPDCDEPVVRHPGEKFHRWAQRLCCCAACGALKGNVQPTAFIPAPYDDGLSGQCFARYDRDPGDDHPFRMLPPATHVATHSISEGNGP